MNFSNIKQSLEKIDYAWTKPQTYLVFVPGISLIIQKIQLANTLPLMGVSKQLTPENAAQAEAKSRKFADICKWHLMGSIVQMAACAIAIKTFALPLFVLVGALATYELIDTLIKSLNNPIWISEFDADGRMKGGVHTTVYNLFF